MARTLNFEILGEPTPKQSARHAVNNGRITSWQPAKIKNQTAFIRDAITQQLPEDFIPFNGVPLFVKIHFLFVKPKSIRKGTTQKTTKPDVDNLMKLVLDAMQGIVYLNDANIVELTGVKEFSLIDRPATLIFVAQLPEGDHDRSKKETSDTLFEWRTKDNSPVRSRNTDETTI